MKKLILIISGLSILLFTGCSQHLGYINTNQVVSTKNVALKNYALNEKKSTYIGSTMIRVKDYKTITTSTDEMMATEDFIFNTDGSTQFPFSKNDIFQIKGSWELDGITYKAVTHPSLKGSHLLINNEGKIHNKIVNIIPFGFQAGEAVTVIYTYKYNPSTVRLETVTSSKDEITKGKVNYELIYTGTNKDSFMLTYREYTAEDMARASFFQNLTYPKSSTKIRFRNLLIKVDSIDSEKITFTVLEDNL